VHKVAALALGIPVVLVASLLASGCGSGTSDSSRGKDGGVGAGGVSGTGGSPVLGGSAGGGTTGADAETSVGDAGASIPPACTGFSACGGSIVGTWKLPGKVLCGSAGSGTPPASNCYAANNLGDLLQSGTLTFSTDGTWVSSMTFAGTETLTYSASCLSGGTTCAERGANVTDAGMVGSCVENASGVCVCTYTLDKMSLSGHGTYTTSAGRLSVVGSDPSSMDYCIQGNTLSMFAVNSSTGDSATQLYERQ
jgi:hypothetical protein